MEEEQSAGKRRRKRKKRKKRQKPEEDGFDGAEDLESEKIQEEIPAEEELTRDSIVGSTVKFLANRYNDAKKSAKDKQVCFPGAMPFCRLTIFLPGNRIQNKR